MQRWNDRFIYSQQLRKEEMPDIWAEASVLLSKLYYLLTAKLEMPPLTRYNLLNVSKSLRIERGYNTGFACIFQVPVWASPLCQDKPTCYQRYWLLLARCQDIRCLIWNLIFISAVISLVIKDRFLFFFFSLSVKDCFCFLLFFNKQ